MKDAWLRTVHTQCLESRRSRPLRSRLLRNHLDPSGPSKDPKLSYTDSLWHRCLQPSAWVVHVLSGNHGWSLGKLGEEATSESVLNRRQRRRGWHLVNGMYFGGHGDIDHVLVGPGGVFVIETKWTANPCCISGRRIEGLMGREPLRQARQGAEKVERMLRRGSGHFEVSVQPVVVLWGPGGLDLPDGSTIVENVLVCEGRQRKLWGRSTGRGESRPSDS